MKGSGVVGARPLRGRREDQGLCLRRGAAAALRRWPSRRVGFRRDRKGFGRRGRSATPRPSRSSVFPEGSGVVGARPLRGRRGQPALLTTLRHRRNSAGSGVVGARPLRGRREEPGLSLRSGSFAGPHRQPTRAPKDRHTLGRSERPAFRRLRLLQDMASAPLKGGAPATSCRRSVGRHVGRLLRRFRDSQRSTRGVVGPRGAAPRAAFHFGAH